MERSILIVDDDTDLRTGLVELLEHETFAVRSAENGRDALAALQTGPRPSLILLDLMMPVMSGWEFIEAASKDEALASIPIWVMTALPPGAPTPDNVFAVVRKPFDVAALIRALHSWLD